jgi:hypothetical protein
MVALFQEVSSQQAVLRGCLHVCGKHDRNYCIIFANIRTPACTETTMTRRLLAVLASRVDAHESMLIRSNVTVQRLRNSTTTIQGCMVRAKCLHIFSKQGSKYCIIYASRALRHSKVSIRQRLLG